MQFFLFLLLESFDIRKNMFGCWQEDGGSVLPTRFMATAEQRHAVPKLSRSVLDVFVYWAKQIYAGEPFIIIKFIKNLRIRE